MTPQLFESQASAWAAAILHIGLLLIAAGGALYAALRSVAHDQQIKDISARQNRQGDKLAAQDGDIKAVMLNVVPPAPLVPDPPPAPRPISVTITTDRPLSADELHAAHAAIDAQQTAPPRTDLDPNRVDFQSAAVQAQTYTGGTP